MTPYPASFACWSGPRGGAAHSQVHWQTLGLAATLPSALLHGLTAQGVPAADAARVAALPPVSVLFASLLGYNPAQTLLGPVIAHLAPARAAYLTGRGFFPSLITASFGHGLSAAFDFAIAACLVAALASLLRGGRYVHGEQLQETSPEPGRLAPGRTATPLRARWRWRRTARPGSPPGSRNTSTPRCNCSRISAAPARGRRRPPRAGSPH
jgi:hypothetical protein